MAAARRSNDECTSREIEHLQFEMMVKLGANRRIELACEMFATVRESILPSRVDGMPEKIDKKRQYFDRMSAAHCRLISLRTRVNPMKRFPFIIFAIFLLASISSAASGDHDQPERTVLRRASRCRLSKFDAARIFAFAERFSIPAVEYSFQPEKFLSAGFGLFGERASCSETIKLLREGSGVRTAVRFRDGKIYANGVQRKLPRRRSSGVWTFPDMPRQILLWNSIVRIRG